MNAIEKCYVGSSKELRQALGKNGDCIIYLQKNVLVEECLVAKGKKVLDGGGVYSIQRKVQGEQSYTGTILSAQGQWLQLRAITVEGGGRKVDAPQAVQGRLVEVRQGTMILGEGSTLKENYNLTSKSYGGGGILVANGGRVVLKDGSRIQDNLTMSAGAGVRVEKGGFLVMEGGVVQGNAAVGQSTKSGYDGRGGGIYNAGTVILQSGSVTGNLARSYQPKGRRYGGRGDGIYNDGMLRWDGNVIVSSLYLAEEKWIQLTKNWNSVEACVVECEEKQEGRVVVRADTKCRTGWQEKFVLKNKSGYELKRLGNTLQLKKEIEKNTKKSAEVQETPCPTTKPKKHREKASHSSTATREPLIRRTPSLRPSMAPTKTEAPLRTEVPTMLEVLAKEETPNTETVEILQTKEVSGQVQILRDASGVGLMQQSVWRLPEYQQLLQQTFQKTSSVCEMSWEVSAKEMVSMRSTVTECLKKTELERCHIFLERYGEGMVTE
nr:hypothetical protein [Eubacterium sp.]